MVEPYMFKLIADAYLYALLLSQCYYNCVIKFVMCCRLKAIGVIAGATAPTQIFAGMVVVPRSTGAVRIYADTS